MSFSFCKLNHHFIRSIVAFDYFNTKPAEMAGFVFF